MSYSQITDQIWVGSDMCCSGHFRKLLDLGITADIDLERERRERPSQKMDFYLWLPVTDKAPPSQVQLEVGVCALEKLVRRGLKVYVHCRFGHGRSPTLVVAYFITQGAKVEEAIEKIAQMRPEIHLTDSQHQALSDFVKRNPDSGIRKVP